MLKKSVLVVALLFMATNLWAVPPNLPLDVSQSRHNFGSTSAWGEGQYRATNEDEVCIFCHTPHGGSVAVPLWNRAINPLQTPDGFTHYTSTTLSPYFQTPAMKNRTNVNSESLLCMSCHDGTAAINSIHNISNRTGELPNGGDGTTPGYPDNIIAMFGIPGASIGDAPGGPGVLSTLNPGKDLSDDHPISFSYYEAVAVSGGKLNAVGGGNDPVDDGIRFFGPGNEQRVECGSCHDPHVNYEGVGGDPAYGPFLVMSNSGSALCLSCHVK